jgi:hypothetical protein
MAIIALGAAAVVAALAFSSARADSGVVASGELSAFATSSDPSISGRALMIRTGDGQTIVTVHVEGLGPSTTYGSHVHKQACADNFADGHYQHVPGGVVTPPNEIWPAFTTNAAGIGNGRAMVDYTARPEAMSVVIHAPGGAKIACADLQP